MTSTTTIRDVDNVSDTRRVPIQAFFATAQAPSAACGPVIWRSSVGPLGTAARPATTKRPCNPRIRELAHARPRSGFTRIWVLLRREGRPVNRKRVRRLYRLDGGDAADGLQLHVESAGTRAFDFNLGWTPERLPTSAPPPGIPTSIPRSAARYSVAGAAWSESRSCQASPSLANACAQPLPLSFNKALESMRARRRLREPCGIMSTSSFTC